MATVLNIKSGIVADHGSDWLDFKNWINGTHGRLRHTWVDSSDHYMILALDGQLTRVVHLTKSSPPTSDQLDFESQYMNLAVIEPRTADGRLVITQGPYAHTEESARFVGFRYVCPANSTTNHDELISQKIRLQGGQYWASTPTSGDTVTLSVVDKDNVLGYGAGTILVEYVKNLPLAPWEHHLEVSSPNAGTVPAGVYLRIAYTNTGNSDVDFGVIYRWYQ
jgi:hypothetical protein